MIKHRYTLIDFINYDIVVVVKNNYSQLIDNNICYLKKYAEGKKEQETEKINSNNKHA